MRTIYVCGEAVADLHQNPQLPEQFSLTLGGSQVFTAVGIARALEGTPEATYIQPYFVGCLSHDSLGNLFAKHLRKSGVDLNHTQRCAAPTPTATVTQENGQNHFSFSDKDGAWCQPLHSRTTEHIAKNKAQKIFAFGSVSALLSPIRQDFLSIANDANEKGHIVYYDLNIRPDLFHGMNLQKLVNPWLCCANIVRASTEDLAHLYPGVAQEQIIADWHQNGVQVAIVTDGDKGATLYFENGDKHYRVHQKAPSMQTVTTVGAGDNFNAGVLAYLAKEDIMTVPELRNLSEANANNLLTFAQETAVRHLERMGGVRLEHLLG